MKLKRTPLSTDQDEIQRAYLMLKDFMGQNSGIETSLWASAFWSILANGYINYGFSYDEFRNELIRILEHSKQWFEK